MSSEDKIAITSAPRHLSDVDELRIFETEMGIRYLGTTPTKISRNRHYK